MHPTSQDRPLALVTGAAVALELARDGGDVATTFWRPYDAAVFPGTDPADVDWLQSNGGLR